MDADLAVRRRPYVLLLKRYSEVRVLKSSTTIAFGTECDPHVAFVECDIRVRVETRPLRRHESLGPRLGLKHARSTFGVETQPPRLTKDARSAFGLKRDPRIWHEAHV